MHVFLWLIHWAFCGYSINKKVCVCLFEIGVRLEKRKQHIIGGEKSNNNKRLITLDYSVIVCFSNKTKAKNAEYCVSSWNKRHQVAVQCPSFPHKFNQDLIKYIAARARARTHTTRSNIIRNDTWTNQVYSSITEKKSEHCTYWANEHLSTSSFEFFFICSSSLGFRVSNRTDEQ